MIYFSKNDDKQLFKSVVFNNKSRVNKNMSKYASYKAKCLATWI